MSHTSKENGVLDAEKGGEGGGEEWRGHGWEEICETGFT